jgi:hypothetical protein
MPSVSMAYAGIHYFWYLLADMIPMIVDVEWVKLST